MSNSKEFSGKVVLITGASSGIGAETAIHFAKLGAGVAITGRNLENLQKTEQKCIQPDTPKPLLIQADLTNEENVKEIMEKTIEHFGRLDVLVNNAGIWGKSSIESATLDLYEHFFNTNVKSVFLLTHLAVPHLKVTKGSIINVSSLLGLIARPNRLVYGMSKSALNQFTRCTALDLAPYGIRVNCVNPGVIETEIFQKLGLTDEQVKEHMENVKRMYPLGRIGQTEEVANAITFLASEKASFITGVLLPIDGGFHATSSN